MPNLDYLQTLNDKAQETRKPIIPFLYLNQDTNPDHIGKAGEWVDLENNTILGKSFNAVLLAVKPLYFYKDTKAKKTMYFDAEEVRNDKVKFSQDFNDDGRKIYSYNNNDLNYCEVIYLLVKPKGKNPYLATTRISGGGLINWFSFKKVLERYTVEIDGNKFAIPFDAITIKVSSETKTSSHHSGATYLAATYTIGDVVSEEVYTEIQSIKQAKQTLLISN